MDRFGLLNAIVGLAFLLSASLQLNDPDPWAWVLAYALAAMACWQDTRPQPLTWLPPVLAVLCGIWLMWLLPTVLAANPGAQWWNSFSMQSRADELLREAGGLVLIVVWMLVLWPRLLAAR